MSALKNADVKNRLKSKFKFRMENGARHDTFVLEHPDGTQLAYVQVPRHRDDIGPALQSLMARQLTVPANTFRDMIRCTVSREEFLDLIGVSVQELDQGSRPIEP